MDIVLLSFFVALVLASLIYLLSTSSMKQNNYPPGPPGIPILGNIHHLGADPIFKLAKLSKKYGNVIGFKAFGVNLVYLHGYEANREMLFVKAKQFCNRPPHKFFTPKEACGIGEGNGHIWATNRRLFHMVVKEQRSSGGGENGIMTEAPYMIKELEKLSRSGEAIDPVNTINLAMLNVSASLLFGDRYEYEDDRMEKLMKITNDMFKIAESYKDKRVLLPLIFPKLSKLWVPEIAKRIKATAQKVVDFCAEEVEAHKKTFDAKCLRGFIDHYLLKIEEEKSAANGKRLYTEHELSVILMDLLISGPASTSTALCWAILYMAGHQDIQENVQREIDQVLGLDEEATYDDRLKLPYTYATVHEVLRFSSISAEGPVHSPEHDTELCGYTIPKGTLVCPDLYSSHFQADKWKDANRFNPENFLSEDGKFQPNDALMVFGGGLRICLAMSIAKEQIFLLFVALLRKCKILPEKDGMELSYEPVKKYLLTSQQYNYRFARRS